MKRYAIINNGIVLNAIEYEDAPIGTPPGFEEGSIAIEELFAAPGWMYANGIFTNPNPPETITTTPTPSLIDIILANPTELEKLKKALGIT